MSSKESIIASFVAAAPPGELSHVVTDIKALASQQPSLLQSLEPAYKQYNEEQYTTVKPPGSGEPVIISTHNCLGGNRYFDTASQTAFDVDHASQKTSNSESHAPPTPHTDLIRALHRSFAAAAAEHFPTATVGVFPDAATAAGSSSQLTLLLVANKYSPQNFWNARWRSTYHLDPAAGSVSGVIRADVHYYEDGNVRMATSKKVEAVSVGAAAEDVVREIARIENKFQEELNRAFVALAEGSFKGLRRQLPVTRQRVEWERIGGYRLGQDIGGGRSK